jgi:hypothetical protein
MKDARRTVENQHAQLSVRRFEHNEHFPATRLGARKVLGTRNEITQLSVVACSSRCRRLTSVLYRRQLEDQQLPLVSSSTVELASSHL